MRILLCEDDEAVRRLLKILLTRYGFTVIETADGPEALSAMKAGGFDLLITDVILGEDGISGMDVAQAFLATCPGKALVMSGYVLSPLEGFEDRAGFLQKPFTPPELVAVLAELGVGVG